MYSLNKYKFNKQIFLPTLSSILNKIIRKEIEYNIINLKSIAYNTDVLTNVLALLLKKRQVSAPRTMSRILNRAYLPIVDIIKARLYRKDIAAALALAAAAAAAQAKAKAHSLFLSAPHKYKDLKLISILNNTASVYTYPYKDINTNHEPACSAREGTPLCPASNYYRANNFDKLLGDSFNTKQIHNTIYNSIGYKNMSGIRLEIKGRLTKRYRAERSISLLK